MTWQQRYHHTAPWCTRTATLLYIIQICSIQFHHSKANIWPPCYICSSNLYNSIPRQTFEHTFLCALDSWLRVFSTQLPGLMSGVSSLIPNLPRFAWVIPGVSKFAEAPDLSNESKVALIQLPSICRSRLYHVLSFILISLSAAV